MTKDKRSTQNPIPYLILVLVVIIILVFVIIKVNTTPEITTSTEDYYTDGKIDLEKLNKYLEENDYSWRAKDSEHLRLYNSLSKEEREKQEYQVVVLPEDMQGVDIFGETIDETNYQDYLNEDSSIGDSSDITGLAIAKPTSKILNLPFPAKDQKGCGACAAFATVGAAETYLYNKHNVKINFSEQYLMSYLNNMGCSGHNPLTYSTQITRKMPAEMVFKSQPINFLSNNPFSLLGLSKNLVKESNSVLNYFKKRKWIDVNKKKYFITKESRENVPSINLVTPVQQTIGLEEPPIGLVLESDIPLTSEVYDACEIKAINSKNPNLAVTGMSLKNYKEDLPKSIALNSNFCSDYDDSSDKFYKLTNSDNNRKIYFIDSAITIDGAALCKANKQEEVVSLMKKAIASGSPVQINIKSTSSLNAGPQGVWEYTKSELDAIKLLLKNKKYKITHAVYIYGYDKDKKTNKEYWLLRNSWGPDWGINGNFKMWIADNNYLLECNSYAFYFKGGYKEETFGKYKIYDKAYELSGWLDTHVLFPYGNFIENLVGDNYDSEVVNKMDSISSDQFITCNEKIPDYIKEGQCKGEFGNIIGKTGSDNYYKDDFDKLLLSWKDVTDTDCDFGAKYCDQDQLRSALSGKLDLFEDSITLGDLKFKRFCYDNLCTGISPAEELNPIILDYYKVFTTDLNTSDSKTTNQYLDTKLQLLPSHLRKYLILTTSFDGNTSEKADIDAFFNEFLSEHYSYEINDKTYYQLRLDYWLNSREKIFNSTDKNHTTILSEFSRNLNIYFGAPINKNIIISKDLGNINSLDNTELFTRTQFLDNYWKLDFNNTDLNVTFGVYELELSNIDSSNKTSKITITKIKDLTYDNKLPSQPINAITNEYFGLNLTTNYQNPKTIPVTIFNDYKDWEKISTGKILSFDMNSTSGLGNIEYIDTTPVQVYFSDTVIDENVSEDKNRTVYYVDSQENLNVLFDTNKNYNLLYLFDNYKYPYNQIQIKETCNGNCSDPIIGNAPAKFYDQNISQTITIPSVIGNRKTENTLEYLINGIKEGSVCYSVTENTIEFKHNPEFRKYNAHYAVSNTQKRKGIIPFFDWSILIDSNDTIIDYNVYSNDKNIDILTNNLFFVDQNITINFDRNYGEEIYFFWNSDFNVTRIQEQLYNLEDATMTDISSEKLYLEYNDYNYFKLSSKDNNLSLSLKNEPINLIIIKDRNGTYLYDYLNIINTKDYNLEAYNNCSINKKIICNVFGCDSNISCAHTLDFDSDFIFYNKQLDYEVLHPNPTCPINKD